MAPTATRTRSKKAAPKAAPVADVVMTLVLDESGSMDNDAYRHTTMRDDTIDGINCLLEEQRKVDGGKVLLSVLTFNNTNRTPIVLTDIREVAPFTEADYRPAGGTALYDAVGAAIEGMDGYLANNPDKAVLPVIVIWTDGENNSSRRWSLAQMNAAVAERRERGWTFMFLGSGAAAWTEGAAVADFIGHHQVVQVACDAGGTYGSYAGVSATLTSARSVGSFAGQNLNSAVMTAQADGTSARWQAESKSRRRR